MGLQIYQGGLATITITTTDQFGRPTPPDNLVLPSYNVDYITPAVPQNIITGGVMIPITNTFYYANLDTTTLSTGSYLVTTFTTIGSMPMNYPVRLDIVPASGFTLLNEDPITRLRRRLRDFDDDPVRWVWTDTELTEYLQGSLEEFNSAPAKTNFYWFNLPIVYTTNILKGAEVAALEAEAIKIVQRPITYNDKGLTVNLQQQVASLQSIARQLREQQEQERLRIKRNIPKSIGQIVQAGNMAYLNDPPIRSAGGRFWM